MNKKEIKRREEKEENNKKKRPRNYIKKEKLKKIRAYGRTRFPSLPSPAGMSLIKLSHGRNNSVMTSLFPPRESFVVTSRLGAGNSRTFFYGVHNFAPKYCRKDQRSCDGRGQGTSYFTASAVCMWSSGKKSAFDVGGPSSIDFIYFWVSNEKQRSCDGWGGGWARSALFFVAMSSKRRVRAAHGRARAAKTH
jgi:hypothetical protein